MIQSISSGLIEFTPGKLLRRPKVKEFIPLHFDDHGEVHADIEFEDCWMRFRYWIHRGLYYEGKDGTKELYLCDIDVPDLKQKGYIPHKAGLYAIKITGYTQEDALGKRLQESWYGTPITQLLFRQLPQEGLDQIIIGNENGELQVEIEHQSLHGFEYSAFGGQKKIYMKKGRDHRYLKVYSERVIFNAIADLANPSQPNLVSSALHEAAQEAGLSGDFFTKKSISNLEENTGEVHDLGEYIV